MKSKLSRRITWRVILIMLFFNVFIIGAVIVFELSVTTIESGARAQSIIDGIDTEQETNLAPGSIIFLYTDGLTEAENAQHELFGDERISSIITSFEGSTQSLIETMTKTVHQFVGNTEQSDDLTMLAVQWGHDEHESDGRF
jgi:serine phosphatase RsbU (regulator of sigma subunit)